MNDKGVNKGLLDRFGRKHSYLRISLTELCNLRCNYCMPEEGVKLSPKSHLMSYEEIYEIAKVFVQQGVNKIRLTGGEPLVRKDVDIVIKKLASLPVELTITTNAVNIHQHIELLKESGICKINVSLDTLDELKFKLITRRNHFKRVMNNIELLLEHDFIVKINVVLMRGFNEDEIIDFIRMTCDKDITVRFIEFMPFNGNQWNLSKMVSYAELMEIVEQEFSPASLIRMEDEVHDTSKNYKIKGFQGRFAVISSVTNPFCDSCNRLRLTADGQLKNCLFSNNETDLLQALRAGKDMNKLIDQSLMAKEKMRAGMDSLDKLKTPELHLKNRNMTVIGG